MSSSTPELPPPPSEPPPPPVPAASGPLQNKKVLIGLVVAAVALLMLGCCCCGGCVLVNRNLASNSRLVGSWKGKDTLGLGIEFDLQLKSNGRYEYHVKMFGNTGTSTGDWRVKLVEGDRYILDTINDGSPDETIGWTVNFESADEIILSQPNGDSWRLKRQ